MLSHFTTEAFAQVSKASVGVRGGGKGVISARHVFIKDVVSKLDVEALNLSLYNMWRPRAPLILIIRQ